MKNLFLIGMSIFISMNAFSQTAPPPPPPDPPAPMENVGQVQNATGFVQSKSFAPSGSMVKPSPFLAGADLAFISNPTFEGGFRAGFSLGYAKTSTNGSKTFGGNGIATFDLTRRSFNIFYGRNRKTYSAFISTAFAQIGLDCSYGPAFTVLFKRKAFNYGSTLGWSFIDGATYRIMSPTAVIIINKPMQIGKRIKYTPELFATFANPYYSRDAMAWSNDLTVNAIVGNSIGLLIGKSFIMNVDWRVNINTNPKLGIMHNLLIGTNYKF
jgi:hypothetical protein